MAEHKNGNQAFLDQQIEMALDIAVNLARYKTDGDRSSSLFTIADELLAGLERVAKRYPEFHGLPSLLSARLPSPGSRILEYGEFSFNLSDHIFISRLGNKGRLTPYEAYILTKLMLNQGMFVTREALVDTLDPNLSKDTSPEVVKTHISHLRSKLDHPGMNLSDPEAKSHILGLPRIGYKLITCDI